MSKADCHAHIIAPAQFPFADGPGYKPRPDEVGDRHAFGKTLAAHGVSHALLVQPSCYGTDNAAMLDAMRANGAWIKGIAVVPPDISDRDIRRLKDEGVVGIRLNLMRTDPAALTRPETNALLSRVKAVGWVVQVYATGDVWAGIEAPLRRNRARVVIDHFGDPDLTRGIDQPGFQAVLRLGRDTDAVVKLSAPYRPSRRPFPHEDTEPFVAAAVQTFGMDRCVWGSDWPFLNTSQHVEYGSSLRLLNRWLPDPADRDRVLWTTPARLFGFTQSSSTP